MFNRLFWRDAIERAIATAAQSTLAVLGADVIDVIGDVDWKGALSVAAGGALLSILKALAAAKVANTISPASLAHTNPEGT